jgi:hypothetical protein
MRMRDDIGVLYDDPMFANLYDAGSQLEPHRVCRGPFRLSRPDDTIRLFL